MNNSNFNNKDIAKVLLQRAKNTRSLSKAEEKYDSDIENVSEYKTNEITSYLIREGCISAHPVFMKPPSPDIIIMPYPSSDGEGLSEKGEDKLADLIKSFKEEESTIFKKRLSKLIEGIIGILIAVLTAFIIWICGWG